MKLTDMYDENVLIKGFPSASTVIAIVGAFAFIFGAWINDSFEYYSINSVIDFYSKEWLFMLPAPFTFFVIAKVLQRLNFPETARFIGMIFYLTVFYNISLIFLHVTHDVPQKDKYLALAFIGCCLFAGGISGVLAKITFPVAAEEKNTDDNNEAGSV